jgi:hypothetical protein
VLRHLLLAILLTCSWPLQAQQVDSVLLRSDPVLAELDSILNSSDSTSFLSLLDSILKMPTTPDRSQLAVRIGYNSNVASTSRSLQIGQFGLSPGISYFHKSGAYADVSAYWSQEFKPSYYLTVATAGFLGMIGKRYTLMAEYSHFFYKASNDSLSFTPYTNSLGVSNFMDVKPFLFRLDYAFFFGEQSAHRLTPSISLNLVKRNWGRIKRLAVMPTYGLMLGSETIISYEFYADWRQRSLGNLVRERFNRPLLPLYYEVRTRAFGIMNHAFSLPISVSFGSWSFLVNYSYNLPRALPGETLTLTNSGFLALNITRYINW